MPLVIRHHAQNTAIEDYPFEVARINPEHSDESIAVFRRKFDAELFLISLHTLRELLENMKRNE